MIRAKLLAGVAVGLSAAACTYNSTTTSAIPPGPGRVVVASSSGQACVEYGFPPGTIGYERCVQREQEARARGRVPREYADSQLTADARDACYSYGLDPASPPYARCVGREVDARRFRADQAYAASPAIYPQPAYVPAAPPPPPAGVQAFRDEYGFRYDGQGNRLDARGNIISPQSTQP